MEKLLWNYVGQLLSKVKKVNLHSYYIPSRYEVDIDKEKLDELLSIISMMVEEQTGVKVLIPTEEEAKALTDAMKEGTKNAE